MRQEERFACGAAAVRAVCHFFGVGPDTEAEFIESLDSNPTEGTRIAAIVAYLESLGLRTAATSLTLEDLHQATENRSPVICPVQREGTGHYVVVTGADSEGVTYLDPIDGITTEDAESFAAKWHDQDTEGNVFDSYGIVVTKPEAHTRAQTTARTKAVTSDSFPAPDPIAEVLRSFFAKLYGHITGEQGKAFFPVGDFAGDLATELIPVIRAALEEGGNAILAQLGGDTRSVLPPLKLTEVAKELAKRLAQSTLDTTNLELEAAHQAVRDAIANGLEAGEANAQLTDRIQGIFTRLTEEHAYLIAETESAAAKHEGELLAIRESGVECQKVWLCDNMACEKCRPLNGQVRELEEPFITLPGGGPYAVVTAPPYHPACRCTLQYVFPEEES